MGSESDDQLNKIADALKEKEELILEVQQSLNRDENRKAYAIFSTKMDYCRQNGTADGPALFTAANAIKDSDTKFQKYVESRLEGNPSNGDLGEKCLKLYDMDVIDTHIDQNIARRNEHILSVFTTQGIAADRIQMMPIGDKVTPKGKTLVSFNVQVKDE